MDNELRINFRNANFELIKSILDVNDSEIFKLYDECDLLGYPDKPPGSLWTNEGKLIYILIRLLKPNNILELGNYKGVSTNFILKALRKNQTGKVTLVDIDCQLDYSSLNSYPFIRYVDDTLKFLRKKNKFDFILVDDNHDYKHVKKELQLIRENNFSESLIILGHDYFSAPRDNVNVKKAVDEESFKWSKFFTSITNESDCGQYILIK